MRNWEKSLQQLNKTLSDFEKENDFLRARMLMLHDCSDYGDAKEGDLACTYCMRQNHDLYKKCVKFTKEFKFKN